MIGAQVQNRGRHQIERLRGIELVARQFEHIQFGCRVEQLQRRVTQIAANARTASRTTRHASDQRGHRALAIGTGDTNHRSAHRARE